MNKPEDLTEYTLCEGCPCLGIRVGEDENSDGELFEYTSGFHCNLDFDSNSYRFRKGDVEPDIDAHHRNTETQASTDCKLESIKYDGKVFKPARFLARKELNIYRKRQVNARNYFK